MLRVARFTDQLVRVILVRVRHTQLIDTNPANCKNQINAFAIFKKKEKNDVNIFNSKCSWNIKKQTSSTLITEIVELRAHDIFTGIQM